MTESEVPADEGLAVWAEPMIRAIVVCRTDGCRLAGLALDLEYAGALVCGGCNTEITDITPTEGA